jgi:hypothetical protein
VAWAGTKLFVGIGMVLLLLLPPLLFVSISTTTTLFDNSLYLTNRVVNIVNLGFFRFPYHFLLLTLAL